MKGARSKGEIKKADNRAATTGGSHRLAKHRWKLQAKKGKAKKDPNKPKRPAAAFFVFVEDFRKMYKEMNRENKSVVVVGKAGGDKWTSMSEAKKAPYVSKAKERKVEYAKKMLIYNNGKNRQDENEVEDDKPDKLISEEARDDEDDDESADYDYEEYNNEDDD